VEERGIACAYHGWLYDTRGNCLETPAEPADSKLYLTIKHRAYPVEKYLGLYWAYLGPGPTPLMRQLDVGAYPINGIREMAFAVSWVQIMENHMDLTHGYILHQDTGDTFGRKGPGVPNTTRGRIDSLEFIKYEELPFGLSRQAAPNDDENGLLVFPNMLRRSNQVQIHVPIDDTHTRTFKLSFSRDRDGYDGDSDHEPVDYFILQPGEAKSGTGRYPDVRYRMDVLTGQDVMAIETQGAVAPRPAWRLATGDRGVELFDNILAREMDRVQEGLEPMAMVKDTHEVIDTEFEAYTQKQSSEGTGSQQYPREGLQVYARAGAHRA
jgi:5,5'-dehydrodivanillate O-demethylase